MNKRTVGVVAAIIGALSVAAWLSGAIGRGTAEKPRSDRETESRILGVAGTYSEWPRVSNTAQWAPTMCVPAPSVFLSQSDDSATHGRKLYYLFANDVEAYLAMPTAGLKWSAPVGLALVKQSWVPEKIDETNATWDALSDEEGNLYAPDEQGPLFVMLKVNEGGEGTDRGWVYATLTPDGKTITQSGRIESCMACHENAPHDRLFGVPQMDSVAR